MNRMKDKRQTYLISLLMSVSMVLLLGFIIYWIFGQYQKEKHRLIMDLNNRFIESQNQVLDSLIMDQFVNPALMDSIEHNEKTSKFYKNFTFSDTTDKIEVITHNKFEKQESKEFERKHGTVMTIKLKADSLQRDTVNDTLHIIKSTRGDMILRSIKLFVRDTENKILTDSTDMFYYHMPIDTNLFKGIFKGHLNEHGMSFDLEWISENLHDSVLADRNGIFLSSDFSYNLPDVKISNYFWHILSIIYPQTLFALLLISISAFAFYFTYRNFKRQMMLNTLRNNFVSNISHELKTPISTVLVTLEAIKKYNTTNETDLVNEYVDLMFDEMKRFDLLISKVMDHSVLESGKAVLQKIETNLSKLIFGIIGKLKLQFPDVNIDYVNGEEHILNIDPILISGVIYNLLDNSIKYAGVKSKIEIILEENAYHLKLIFRDNGPGIKEEYLSKLFDKFFRIPTGDKHNVKGYGLGLSYAKLVMDEHEGTILAENNTHAGCSFTLTFPK